MTTQYIHDAYGNKSADPTCKDEVTGILYDFNYGCCIKTPDNDVVWDLKLYNDETDDLLYETKLPSNSYYSTPIKYYIKWRIELSSRLGSFKHTMELKDKTVALKMAHKTLGDCIAYMSQIPAFVEKHHCKPIIYAQQWFIDVFSLSYPDYIFKELKDENVNEHYATYYIGLVFEEDEAARCCQKYPFQIKGLQHQSAHILGLPDSNEPKPPKVCITAKPDIKEHYVCIGYSGTKACKFWNNPIGWDKVIRYLKSQGFRVFCIDRDFMVGMPGSFYRRPEGCEDVIGNIPLQERINLLAGASMFIGVGSGLSWLAWCCNIPVILISGFSLPHAEFYTPYRVFNEEAKCVGCWNDINIKFSHHDFSWCPRVDAKILEISNRINNCTDPYTKSILLDERTKLQCDKFICSQTITGERVIKMIEKVRKDYHV